MIVSTEFRARYPYWGPWPLERLCLALGLGLLLLVLLVPDAQAQRRRAKPRGKKMERLEYQLKRLEMQVDKTEELLRQTRSVKKKSFSELNLLKKQIDLRKQLLNRLNLQIYNIDKEVRKIDGIMQSLREDIEEFQSNYGKAAYVSYKTQNSLSILLWIFSAENFRQAYDRILYFREFSQFRKNQIFLIKRTQSYLQSKRQEKEDKKLEKRRLLSKRTQEKDKLDQTREHKNSLYRELKDSEVLYRKRIKSYKRDMAKIRQKIKELVLASERAEKNAKNQKLSKIFHNNLGKLPWPIPMYNCVVTGNFGKNRTESGTEIVNDGIYISTKKGQTVRAVFSGKVTLISKVPQYGQVVIVQHGNYRTVYANLENIQVKKGDLVDVLQTIGSVKMHRNTGANQIYFQIYKGFTPVDPIRWLSEKQ